MTAQGSGLTAQAIALEGVTKKYGETVAVRELSFSVQPGEMFGLIGPDGAGKTTTIRLMCGLVAVNAGSVRVLDRDPVKQHREVTQAVGYLSQRFSLYGDLTVDENIAFFGRHEAEAGAGVHAGARAQDHSAR
jgi:ABC-2 type transport system ATP-binding protein